MANQRDEKILSRLLFSTLAGVTVLVIASSVTDPVNVPKLFLVGGLSFAVLGVLLYKPMTWVLFKNKLISSLIGLFVLFSISTLVLSKTPFWQSLYGQYGRNNGFTLYIFLSVLFLGALGLRTNSSISRMHMAMLWAGTINVLYAMWVLAFGDFIPWNNQYGALLGTLGNPNFIGSFLGMFSSFLFAQLFNVSTSRLYRLGYLLLIPLTFIAIVQSHAVQGKVLFIAGIGIVLFYLVRDKLNSYFQGGYILLSATAFLLALLGTLQKGPLSGVLYKETVSLRGQYWHSGWNTGTANPWHGAGFDALADWYRRSRRESALQLPGVDTVTNAAHNVYLDMFAFGGWPLFLAYILINLYVLYSILRHTISNKKFDPTFVALVGVWVCYQLQSTISINQIGLAVWGWVIGGAIISYERNSSVAASSDLKEKQAGRSRTTNREKSKQQVFSPGLRAGIASIAGFIIAVPPLASDMQWRSAQISQDANKVEAALQPSYLNPLSMFKINTLVGVFETNNLHDLAHKYALDAVEYNSDSFEAWRNLYRISKSTPEEKALALENMMRLDPLNPDPGFTPE